MSIGLRYTHLDDWNPLISFQVPVLWYFGTYIVYGELFAVARLLLRGSSHSPKFPCFQRTWKSNDNPSPRLSSPKSRPHSNKPPPEPVRRSPSPGPQPTTTTRPPVDALHLPESPTRLPKKEQPAPEPGMRPIYNAVPHQTRPNSAAAEPFENLCSCGYSGRRDRRNRPLPHSPLSAWLNLRKRRMFR